MNKVIKIMIAILGATELIFSIFIPIALSLLLLPYAKSQMTQVFLIIAGILSSLYRALRLWFIKD